MIFRNITDTEDWTFGQGIQNYLTKDDAIKLNIKTRVLSWVNDCFFDTQAGIDWYTRLGKKSQFSLLENDIANLIMKSTGVAGLISFNATLINRVFTAQYNIKTIYSPSVIDAIVKNNNSLA